MATAELTTPPTAAPRREPFPRPWTPAEFDRMRELDLFAGRAVDLIDGQVIEHAPDGTGPRPWSSPGRSTTHFTTTTSFSTNGCN